MQVVQSVRIVRFTQKREIERDEEKQRKILLNREEEEILFLIHCFIK